MSTRTRFALMLAVALVAAPSARAQDATLAAPAAVSGVTATPSVVPSVAPAGPVADAAIVGVRHQVMTETSAAAPQRRGARGTNLMIVGGAMFLAGLLIGDDVGAAIAVGGAAVGIYGLYQYLQ